LRCKYKPKEMKNHHKALNNTK